jgi:uncharacterized membrane protein YdjX (TVP38/TMEM64 family)
VLIAEIVNAFILFFLARKLGRKFVSDSLHARSADLDKKLSGISFFWLFMLRTTPLVPFRFLDLACGLTALSFRKYLVAVVAGSLPRIFWLQYVLAGVGTGIFKGPSGVTRYLLQNPTAFIVTFIYLICMLVVAYKIRTKGK